MHRGDYQKEISALLLVGSETDDRCPFLFRQMDLTDSVYYLVMITHCLGCRVAPVSRALSTFGSSLADGFLHGRRCEYVEITMTIIQTVEMPSPQVGHFSGSKHLISATPRLITQPRCFCRLSFGLWHPQLARKIRARKKTDLRFGYRCEDPARQD